MAGRGFVYLGWQGRHNFGDDLMFDTWRQALGEFVDAAPLYRNELRRSLGRLAVTRLRHLRTDKAVLLGGGTALGFANWAGHVDVTARVYGSRHVVVAGAGAAASDDEYAKAIQGVDWEAWKRLPHPTILGVRGPITAKEMQENWVPTRVIGDPALAYDLATSSTNAARSSAETGRLGICLGSHESTRFDLDDVAQAVSAARREIGVREVAVFALSRSDTDLARRLAAAVSADRVVEYADDVAATMREIRACHAFVSERLHGVVAAAAMGVSCRPLAYASKCDDFWRSVAGDLPAVHPDSGVEELGAAITSAWAQDGLEGISARVERYRSIYGEAFSLLRAWQAGEIASLSEVGLRTAEYVGA